LLPQFLAIAITTFLALSTYAHGCVSSGECASKSEVIRNGLRALQARDKALDTWLRTEVAAAYDEL
jgi:putative addiction module CopG family antidote